MKSRKGILIAGVVLAGGLLIPARRTNPPVAADFDGPAEVESILRRSCYDCHSHETRWPWYSKAGPGSWLVVHDVNEGREHLNFSEWGALDAETRAHAAREIQEEVAEGEMPLPMYVRLHKDAALGEGDKATIAAWVASLEAGK
jgi:hypothetical protein